MDIADLDLPPAEKMSRRKKWCIVGILVTFFGVLLYFYLRDDALQDDSDLSDELPELAEDDNGLRFFDGLMERYEEDFDEDYEKLADMLSDDGAAWDPAFAQAQVERFAPFLKALESAAQAKGIRARTTQTLQDSIDNRLTALDKSVNIGRAAVRLALEFGRTEDAHRIIAAVLAAGGKFAGDSRSLIEFLFASRAIQIGLNMTRDLVTDEKQPSDEAMDDLIRQTLVLIPTVETGVSRAYDGEYRITRDTLLQISDRAAMASLGGEKLPVFLFKKNRTVNKLADQFRQLKSETGGSNGASTPPPKPSIVRLALSGNAAGEILLQMITPISLTQRIVGPLLSQIEILRTVAALRHYHADNGALPESLDALVPKYISAVPVDRFNGKTTLRYDRSRAVIWCVGKNLSDDGAPESDSDKAFGKMDDPAIRLPWLAE